MNILELKNVYKEFKGLRVLSRVSIFPLRKGSATLSSALMGPARARFSTSSRGSTNRPGEDVFRTARTLPGLAPYKIARKGLARSFQIINVFPEVTVYGNMQNAVLSNAGSDSIVLPGSTGCMSRLARQTRIIEMLGLRRSWKTRQANCRTANSGHWR